MATARSSVAGVGWIGGPTSASRSSSKVQRSTEGRLRKSPIAGSGWCRTSQQEAREFADSCWPQPLNMHVGRRLSRGPRPVRRHPRCFRLCWARWRTVPAAVHGATSAAVRDMAARRDDRSRRRGVPPAAVDQPFRVRRALCRHPEQTAEPAPTTRTPRLATAWPPGLRLLTCGAGVAKAVRRRAGRSPTRHNTVQCRRVRQLAAPGFDLRERSRQARAPP